MRYLDELEKLNLPTHEFVIFGSGPMAIRGLRENHDLDILVTERLWYELSETYPVTKKSGRPDSIYAGNLQFLRINYRDWSPDIPDNNILLSDSEIIGNYPFVKLKYLLECKKQMDGPKHRKDIEIIEKYLRGKE